MAGGWYAELSVDNAAGAIEYWPQGPFEFQVFDTTNAQPLVIEDDFDDLGAAAAAFARMRADWRAIRTAARPSA